MTPEGAGMTPEGLPDPAPGCAGDAAAYALGALEPPEATAFRRHLESCVVCRDEFAAFGPVVDALPLSAPPCPPPRALRARILAEARAGSETRSESGQRRSRPRRRRGFTIPRPALAYGAAAVLAVAVLAFIGFAPSSDPSSRVIAAQVTGSIGRAELVLSGTHGEMIVHGLRQPSAGHIYEVWLKRPGQAPQAAGALFDVGSDGSGNVDVPGDLRRFKEVLVTQEPAGGSTAPTTPSVITASL